MANGDAIELELEDKAWEVASVSPVATANGGSTLWAPFGLLDMLNGGGAVSSSRLSMGLGTRFSAVAKVQLRATGDFGAYCEPRPHRVKLDGRSVAFGYDEVRRIVDGTARTVGKYSSRHTVCVSKNCLLPHVKMPGRQC